MTMTTRLRSVIHRETTPILFNKTPKEAAPTMQLPFSRELLIIIAENRLHHQGRP